MKISQNSTQSFYGALKRSVSNLQRDIIDAQKQVSTGKVADSGLYLGVRNAHRVSMNIDIERLDTISTTNGIAKSRLDMSLSAIGAVNEIGQDLLGALTASAGQFSIGGITGQAGKSALSAITGILNTSLNGEALFGGTNSGETPIASFETGGAKAALEAAFQTHFGFAKTDVAAGSISKVDMANFLDSIVEPMFSGTSWETNFSSASDDPIVARISLTESSDASISANESGFRDMMFAAILASEFFDGELGAAAQSATAEKALSVVGKASGELANLQGQTGFLINRIENSSEQLVVKMDELEVMSSQMDSVDPYEAATRLNTLITEIETAYQLTGRIQQLSLMRFI